MKRIWKIEITGDLEGLAIAKILKRELSLTKKQISRIKFTEDGILLNGERKRVTDTARQGDCLCVMLEDGKSQNFLEAAEGELGVLYEDEDLLLVKKPSGLVCHPAHGHYADSLANQVTGYFAGKQEMCVVREVGRLDRDTSGIVVFAKNRMAAAKLADQREKGIFWKEYLVATKGIFERKEGEICLPIGPVEGDLMRMTVRADGKNAVTKYRVIKENEGESLVLCTLRTGRTHQIRVHMSAVGHPVLGDLLYGSNTDTEARRLCLHAQKVCLLQPFTGEKIVCEWKLTEQELKGAVQSQEK
ncbi:MAG: RluA family pseudouridine synthase [Lachnospiraceae bacterium]|nr:RluA family pseudouridine synthase [Lachnospiraceae bacterium]